MTDQHNNAHAVPEKLPSGMATSQADGKWRVTLEFDAHSDADVLKDYMLRNGVPAKSMVTAPAVPQEQPDTFYERNAKFREENWQIRFDAAVEARRQAQEQLYSERERHASEIQALRQEISRLLPSQPAMLAATPAPAPAQYKDSTPHLSVGESLFESWYDQYLLNAPVHQGHKQRARDAYAAGMGDPLVTAKPAQEVGLSPADEQKQAVRVMQWLDSGEWELVRSQPLSFLTDEANAESAWLVRRQAAPYCDKSGTRQWAAKTAFGAFTQAITALRAKGGK